MADLRSFPVFDTNGQIGRVLATARFLDDRAEKTVLLEDGKELQVPASALEIRKDGSFFLRESVAESRPAGPQIVGQQSPEPAPFRESAAAPNGMPPAATQLPTRPQIPTEALFQSGYDIETVNVQKLLDGSAEERHEGDTLILPVVEEVWVVEKRLFLRQEIRITKRDRPVAQAQTIEKLRTN